jgi:ribose transport system substrate-binding protein
LRFSWATTFQVRAQVWRNVSVLQGGITRMWTSSRPFGVGDERKPNSSSGLDTLSIPKIELDEEGCATRAILKMRKVLLSTLTPCEVIMKVSRHFFIGLLTLGLVACGQSNGPDVNTTGQSPKPAAAAPAAPVVQIGLVMKTLTNPYFIEMEKGARRAAKELGVSLQVKTVAQETSIEQQIQQVNDLIAAKVDAIVIAPTDSQSLVAPLKKAADAGIKLVNVDSRLDADAMKKAGLADVPFIGVDNVAGAYKAGQYLADKIASPTNAAILEGIRSADNAQQRLEGARRALAENKNIKVVASETANWKIDEAYNATKTIFAKHPDIKLLFAANDMMAMGAIKYLQESGKTKVKVVGYDALDDAIAEIKAGRMAATVDQQAAEQGYQGVLTAVQLLKGEKVAPLTLVDTRLVSATDAK